MTPRADDDSTGDAPPVHPVAVVSPHFDDAVLSCGRLLAARPGSHVVTVCSGGPWRVFRLPAWDRAGGMFSPGADVMGVRRREDAAALAVVGASGHRLGFWDSQYVADRPWRRKRRTGRPDLVADRLLQLVERLPVTSWVVPLGLVHPDHRVTAAACQRAAIEAPQVEWIAYADQPYAAEKPELVDEELRRITTLGFHTERADLHTGDGAAVKGTAVSCYRSQRAALGARAAVALEAPEVYHRLEWRKSRAA